MTNAYIRAQQCKVKEAKFPFVKIGGQYWTKRNLDLSVTPMGNTIAEVQPNGNVEKFTNNGFTGSATPWIISTGWAYGTDNIIGTNASTTIYQGIPLVTSKWYKRTTVVTSLTSGSVRDASGGYISAPITTSGTFVEFIKSPASNATVGIACTNFSGVIDSISCEEIGWSGSQELYDGIYAQTSGTVEQKTYAAVKAAAMWSNYNNDAPTGLIYGKLYNWFAVKLFQMDIDYYNAANPTKPYIWRMPTQAEFQTLSDYLGGNAVSGGHLKEAGTTHWNSPNTGADNSSGFSALGGGSRRYSIGVFEWATINNRTWGVDKSMLQLGATTSSTSIYTGLDSPGGFSIRLIKT